MLPSDLDELIGGALGASVLELLRQRLVKEIMVPDPAAGSEWSATVPPNVTWELLSVHYRFVTSAVVANRFPLVAVQDPNANEVARLGPSNSVAASQTQAHTGLPAYGQIISGGTTLFPIASPPMIVPTGWVLKSATSSLDVGDQFSQVILCVYEWSMQAVQVNLDQIAKTIR